MRTCDKNIHTSQNNSKHVKTSVFYIFLKVEFLSNITVLLGFAKSIYHYGYYFNFIMFLDIYEMFVLQQSHVV